MKRKNESGVVVVESAIVITIVIMFISVILYIGMVLYQQSLVNIMANQTAANIAQIYGNSLRDPFTGYIDVEGVQETVTYSNMRNQAYMDVIEQKADAAALYRLKSSRILNTGESDVQVEIVPKKNELLKDQIVVTIRDNYDVPLVSFFGVDNTFLSFTGTGRADCTDLLEYLTGIPALGNDDGNAPAFTNECQVNFFKHYGDSRPIVSMTVLKERSINQSTRYYPDSVMPLNPEQDKMKFIKWVTEDGKQFTGETVVNDDIDVYGCWSCNITFDPDGGAITKPENFKNPVTAIVDKKLELPVAERAGCTFAGWYTEKNGKGEPFDGNNVKGDITVYAKWVCTVTLDPYGGTVSPSSFDVVCGQSLSDAGHALPNATRDGCAFAGWFTDFCGDGTQYNNSTKITSHTALRAKYTCTVTLNANGGTVSNSLITAIVGKECGLPTPERAHNGDKGWQFQGWSLNTDGSGDRYTNNFVPGGPTTLYAQWVCNHQYGGSKLIYSAANCLDYNRYERICRYCSHKDLYTGGTGAHDFSGGCGIHHILDNDSYSMENHKGSDYVKTTKAECVICIHCKGGWNPKTNDVGWTWRNGQMVSIGMYCREHEWKDGTKHADYSFEERTDFDIHE